MEDSVQVIVYIIIMVVLVLYNVLKKAKPKEAKGPETTGENDPWKEIRKAFDQMGDEAPSNNQPTDQMPAPFPGMPKTETQDSSLSKPIQGTSQSDQPESIESGPALDSYNAGTFVEGQRLIIENNENTPRGQNINDTNLTDVNNENHGLGESIGENDQGFQEIDLEKAVIYSEILNRKHF